MSGPRPLPPAADHERHDALLVAQLVAGDPLEPEQMSEAQRLVADCGACAALAADLPVVARAVAQEPVPPRRRDHRLSPEQAERLRGNALTRLLRRFSLPSSRAFQPAAAGVLSIGLLLVVAGYAWPDGGTVSVQAEPNLIDWRTAMPSSPAAEAEVAPVAPSLIEAGAARDAEAPDALDGAAEAMEDPEFAESLPRSQAGTSEGLAQKSGAGQDAAEGDVTESNLAESYLAGSAELGVAADGIEPPADDEAADAAVSVADEDATGLSPRALAPDDARGRDVTAEDSAESPASVASASPEALDDGGPPELLVVLGLLLALAGGGLLLVGWLARRARDPLAP
ncbi:MAG: hypothetical protein AB1Z67_06360 [Candidatus Limnocylindrales bacterium]